MAKLQAGTEEGSAAQSGLGMGGWVLCSVGLPCPGTQSGSVPGLCPTDGGSLGRRTCSVGIQQNLNKGNPDMIFCQAGKA